MAKGGTESLLYERCPVAYTTMLSSRVVALTIICLVIKNKNKNHKSLVRLPLLLSVPKLEMNSPLFKEIKFPFQQCMCCYIFILLQLLSLTSAPIFYVLALDKLLLLFTVELLAVGGESK